jgi:hypothetical protein
VELSCFPLLRNKNHDNSHHFSTLYLFFPIHENIQNRQFSMLSSIHIPTNAVSSTSFSSQHTHPYKRSSPLTPLSINLSLSLYHQMPNRSLWTAWQRESVACPVSKQTTYHSRKACTLYSGVTVNRSVARWNYATSLTVLPALMVVLARLGFCATKMDAATSTKSTYNFYPSTRRHIPDDNTFLTVLKEKLQICCVQFEV